MKKKTLIPNDFRDFLSIISFIGFIGIFLAFSFNVNWINENMTGLFLIAGGSAFLIIGKALTSHHWLKDGIQENEPAKILAIVIGVSSIIIGLLFIVKYEVPIRFLGYIGIIALIPAIYTVIDYLKKNTRRY